MTMNAVMYGGGNIGRGFIGALLSQSGYRVTFIDVAAPVVEHLQKNECYPIRYVFSGGHEDVLVENVTAVNGNDTEAASDVIANCDIMALPLAQESSSSSFPTSWQVLESAGPWAASL